MKTLLRSHVAVVVLLGLGTGWILAQQPLAVGQLAEPDRGVDRAATAGGVSV
jgi:hypothetical protein